MCCSVETYSHTPVDTFSDPVCRSFNFDGDVLTIYSDYCDITIQAFTEDIIKVLLHADGKWETDTSFSVIRASLKPEVSFSEEPDMLEFSTKNIKLKIDKNPIKFYYYRGDTIVLQDYATFFKHQGYRGTRLMLHKEEKLYGAGSRAIPLNRNGYDLPMFNRNVCDYKYGENHLNTCIPFFTSSRLYGILYDNHSFSWVHAGTVIDSMFVFNSYNLEFSYYYINGNSYQDILDKYLWLTGNAPLIPRWALGFFMSKFSYVDQESTLMNMYGMRKEGFPIDAVLHDLFWFDNMGDFEWSKTRFPRPQKMLDSLNIMGIKTILISEPFISRNAKDFKYVKESNLIPVNDTGEIESIPILGDLMYLLDFTNEKALDWIWGKYKAMIQGRIDGWWLDLGEPECHNYSIRHKLGLGVDIHNIFSMLWIGKLYEHYRKEFSSQRPFILSRAGWAGMQRYGTISQCGDESRSYSGLKSQIPVMLGMSMSGVSYMHSDAGGFYCWDSIPRNELYARWLEFSAFQPVMRVHMIGWVPVEPIYYPDSIKHIVRDYIKLRYTLLPYNYTLVWKNSAYNRPLAIPMNFDYPFSERLSDINDQYFWGDNFIVAPIVDSAVFKRSVILPDGNWINYWTGEKYKGNQTIEAEAPLEILPLFVRSGCFIPTAPPMMTTENYNGDSLIIKYYPDLEYDSTTFTMYDDDGKTPEAYLKNLYELIEFTGLAKEDKIDILVDKKGYTYSGAPQKRMLVFEVFSPAFRPGMVFVNNEYLRAYKNYETFVANEKCTYYDTARSKLFIKFDWEGSNTTINITDIIDTIEDVDTGEDNIVKIISVSPNPVTENGLLRYYCSNPGYVEIELFDMSGKILSKNTEYAVSGINGYKVDLTHSQQEAYVLRIKAGKSVDCYKLVRSSK